VAPARRNFTIGIVSHETTGCIAPWASTCSEIDDFIRNKNAQQAATAPALPGPEEPPPPQGGSTSEGEPPSSPSGGEAANADTGRAIRGGEAAGNARQPPAPRRPPPSHAAPFPCPPRDRDNASDPCPLGARAATFLGLIQTVQGIQDFQAKQKVGKAYQDARIKVVGKLADVLKVEPAELLSTPFAVTYEAATLPLGRAKLLSSG
jgi:hypothetical protein